DKAAGDPAAVAYAQAARAAQDLIDDPATGYNTLIAENWTDAADLFQDLTSSNITAELAQDMVTYLTAMSTNSTAMYSADAADPTDTIIDEANGVAIITDTDPEDHYRLITVYDGGNLTLINSTLFGGYSDSDTSITPSIAAGRGGAIYIAEDSSATLINVDVTDNSGPDSDPNLFSGNQATEEGGGIYNAGTLTIYEDGSLWSGTGDPSVSNNIAGTSGGGIYSTGTLDIEGDGVNDQVSIYGNSADSGSGGGIYSEGTITQLENIYIQSNTATEYGGGAFITSVDEALTLKTVKFHLNTADGSGGGLAYLDSSADLTIIQSDFMYNNAEVNGGAIYMENTGNLTYLGTNYVSDDYQYCYENVWVYGNTAATGDGGAIYLSRVGDVLINSVDFQYNYIENDGSAGGAIKMTDSGDLTVIDSNFINNWIHDSATATGSAIFYDGGTDGDKTLSVSTSYLGDNWSINDGGAIYQTAGTLTITNVTFDANTAYGNGGAIWMDSSVALAINFATFVNNTATSSGSSIYVYTGPDTSGSITLANTIIYNTYAPSAQIVLPDNFTINSSSYNIFSHYYGYSGHAQDLADGTVTVATNYEDADHNYVGTGSATTEGCAYILANTYISTTAVYTANYKTYTLALTSESSIAYRSGYNDGAVLYDQRGNTRTVDPYGEAITSSRGAFEPIFNLVVTTTEDDTTMLRSDPAGYYANVAWDNGITLREAVYWVDSGDGLPDPTRGVISFNAETYEGHNFYDDDADNTITLNGNQITIGQYRRSYSSDKTIVINGVAASQDAANRIIVDAGNLSRVFCILDGTTTINHLTLTNGAAPSPGSGVEVLGTDTYGGAIYNASGSALTLNNVVVSDSTANAVNYRGAGFGGGIYNAGTLTLNDTTITGNHAIAAADSKHTRTDGGQGGGIYNAGTLNIYRSTIDNNYTTGNAYVSESAKGAGVYNTGSTLYIENSTIAYNYNLPSSSISTGGEGSAIYFLTGTSGTDSLSLINCTIADNYTESTNASANWSLKSAVYIDVQTPDTALTLNLTITNTILADNYVNQKTGSITVGHWNDFYITDTSGYTGFTLTASTTYNVVGFFNYDVYDFRTETSNIVGAYLTDTSNPECGHVQDLYLNPTLDYRGGRTKVLSLLEGSLLLDLATNHGTDVALTSITDYMTGAVIVANPDQRGNTRTSGEYSIGSYQPIFAITVDLTTDSADTNHGWNWTDNEPGWYSDNTLRDAIYWIDPTGVITFATAIWGDTITLNSELGELLIEKSMTIMAGGAIIQAAASAGSATSRVIYLTNPAHLTTTISVTLQNMTIKYGVDDTGGGIYNTVDLTLAGVTITENEATAGFGGGIYSLGGSLTITSAGAVYSEVSYNTASSHGGGIYYEAQSTLNITQVDILGNESAGGSGGGIYVTGAEMNLTASTVGNNIAAINGGGINSMATDITMLNSTVANNQTGELGGGLAYFAGGILNMNFVSIANNISGLTGATSLFGGGIYLSAGSMTISNSVVANNYRASIADDNRDDFYNAGGAVASATYNAIGVSTGYVFDVTTDHNITYADNPDFFTDLGLDTVLSDNGGPTLTLYVSDTDTILQNNADQSTTVTTDQRGEARVAPHITIGAYQKTTNPTAEYVFDAEDDGDYNNYLNWKKDGVRLTSADQLDFDEADATYTIAADLNTGDSTSAESTWEINWRSVTILADGVTLTVAAGDTLNARINVQGTMAVAGTIVVRDYSSVDSSGNGTLSVSGSISTVDTTMNRASRLELQNTATLTLATNSYSNAAMNLALNSSSASTVSYTYDTAGASQVVLTVNNESGTSTAYNSLILSGASSKVSETDLTVETLTFSGASALTVSGDFTINNAAGGTSVADSSVTLSGDLTLTNGNSTSLANVDFTFNGTSAQTITLTAATTVDDITIDNSAGVSLDGDTLTGGNFTFTDGAFTLLNASSINLDSVSGADGDNGLYFITAGTGTVSLPVVSAGTHFLLAVEDSGNPGTYKWVDTVLSATTATRAYVRLIDGVTPAPATPTESSTTVTWDINTNSDEFTFELADYSSNAVGAYFDPNIASLYHYSGGWNEVSYTTTENGNFYLGHDYTEVWLNSDDITLEGTLRYALNALSTTGGVIVFSAIHADTEFTNGADIVLNSVLQVADVNISIFGLDPSIGASNITGADGEQVLIVGTGGGDDSVTLKNLDLHGNGDYVLVDNEDLNLANVSVTGITSAEQWSSAAISNTEAITVVKNMVLELDGSAAGNSFTYQTGSTLQYILTPGAGQGTITIDDDSAEFGTSIQGLTVDSNVALTLSDRTDAAYVINGNVDINGYLVLEGATTITLNGTNIDLGTFSANNSTVIYNDSQNISNVTYYNLVLSGTTDKTATDVTTGGDLEFDSDVTLYVSGAMDIGGSLAPAQGTVTYNGTDQTVADLDYYNLALAGSDTKTAVDLNVDNNLIFDTDVTLAISGTMSLGGSLEHGSKGTVEYTGVSSQPVFGTTYYNLTITNGNKTLAGITSVAGTFTFDDASGYLALGAYDLNIQGTVSNASGADGRYFATDSTAGGRLVLTMNSTYSSRSIVIGTTSNWSSLTLTNLGSGDQDLYLSAKDGVEGVTILDTAVNMTFTVTNTDDFRMVISDSSAAGADFSAANADIFYFNTTSSFWEDEGVQATATLTNSGDYYYDCAGSTDRALVVTNTNDSGLGSLRYAIEYANSHEGVDTVTFSDTVFNSAAGLQTITLTSGELEITDDVIIVGPGIDVVTVDGNSTYRIFNIDDGNASNILMVQVSGLSLTGGNAG
ncbi:MAG: hypothetical protein WC082_03505, partial [Victivallales bacterium]